MKALTVNPKINRRVILILFILYFTLFAFPNLKGARDHQMLSVFQIDEYSQYLHLMNMLKSDSHISGRIGNFLDHGHYLYGYPFYLTSALAVFPLKIIGNTTPLSMLVLRQSSVLFMLAAIFLLVHIWTGFESLFSALYLSVFLMAVPGVFVNNLWWHPDSLTVLLIVLTIYYLNRDNLEFGRDFYWAAFWAGLVTGTRFMGQFFFLTILTYLYLGYREKKIPPKALLKYGLGFLGIMIFVLILSNPPLLVPSKAGAYWRVLKWQVRMNQFGWVYKMDKGIGPWYDAVLKNYYGSYLIYALAVGGCLWGIIRLPHKRLINLIILTWSIPLSLYLFFGVANKSPRYFLPVLVPLFSCLGNYFEPGPVQKKRTLRLALISLVILVSLVQLRSFYWMNTKRYLSALHKEENSPAIAFYQDIYNKYLSGISHEITIFRDHYIYISPAENRQIYMKWKRANYANIKEIDPDLIVLQQKTIHIYADKRVITRSFDRENARKCHEFFLDAENNRIRGYRLILEDSFGKAFVKKPDFLQEPNAL